MLPGKLTANSFSSLFETLTSSNLPGPFIVFLTHFPISYSSQDGSYLAEFLLEKGYEVSDLVTGCRLMEPFGCCSSGFLCFCPFLCMFSTPALDNKSKLQRGMCNMACNHASLLYYLSSNVHWWIPSSPQGIAPLHVSRQLR